LLIQVKAVDRSSIREVHYTNQATSASSRHGQLVAWRPRRDHSSQLSVQVVLSNCPITIHKVPRCPTRGSGHGLIPRGDPPLRHRLETAMVSDLISFCLIIQLMVLHLIQETYPTTAVTEYPTLSLPAMSANTTSSNSLPAPMCHEPTPATSSHVCDTAQEHQ
jgi:hypothetical protein